MLHDVVVHRLHQRVLDFENIIVWWYTCKCNFVYAHYAIYAFPEWIFMKLINAQLYYANLLCQIFLKLGNKCGVQTEMHLHP